MNKTNLYNRGQSFIGIIIVIIIVALFSGGLYYYLSKQAPEISQNTQKSNEEAAKSPEVTPPAEEEPASSPEEEKPIVQKCTDETLYSKCSTNKPKYCNNGNLIDKCSLCSCPSGTICENNKCVKAIEAPGWKTYRNEEYGFEIKYLEKWFPGTDVMSWGFSSPYIINGSEGFSCSLSVSLVGKGANVEYINSFPKDKFIKSEVEINGEPAIKLVSTDSPIVVYYFLKNISKYYEDKYCCEFQIRHGADRYITNKEGEKVGFGDVYSQECMDIFNQMLSTFKILK